MSPAGWFPFGRILNVLGEHGTLKQHDGHLGVRFLGVPFAKVNEHDAELTASTGTVPFFAEKDA